MANPGRTAFPKNDGDRDLRARRPAGAEAGNSATLPQPGDGEILIRVRAAGVNRPDVLQRKGAYPPPPGASDLPGLEVAGEVAALGDEMSSAGASATAVCALTPGGGYAEYCQGARRPTCCRCRPASPSPRPRRCRKPSSPSGTMCSSAAA